MAFTGYIAYRLFDGLRAGIVDRHFWLGSSWHVQRRHEPLTFWFMMFAWSGALAFMCFAMAGMSYGFWTGRWTGRG